MSGCYDQEVENLAKALWQQSLLVRFEPGSCYQLTEISPRASAKYVGLDGSRYDDDAYLQAICRLMTSPDYWNMRKAGLLMEITGSSANFAYIDQTALTNFNCGLVEAAKSADAWIITNGLSRGVTKLVGDAVAQARLAHGGKKPICLGIGPSDKVKHRNKLSPSASPITQTSPITFAPTSSPGSEVIELFKIKQPPSNKLPEVRYPIDFEDEKMREKLLDQFVIDPNHNYLLLVDKDHDRQLGAKLIDRISKNVGTVPSLLVVIGGDANTLKMIGETLHLSNDLTTYSSTLPVISEDDRSDFGGTDQSLRPIVLLKGFRGVADLLSFAYEITESPVMDEEIYRYEFYDEKLASTSTLSPGSNNSRPVSSIPIEVPDVIAPPICCSSPKIDNKNKEPFRLFSPPNTLMAKDVIEATPSPRTGEPLIASLTRLNDSNDSGAGDTSGPSFPSNFEKLIRNHREMEALLEPFSHNEELKERETKRLIQFIKQFVSNRKLITVFDIFDTENRPKKNLHSALLHAIFRADLYEPAVLFELARIWDRADFARIILQKSSFAIKEWLHVELSTDTPVRKRDQIMFDAICDGQGDFCKLLDDYNLIMTKKFVTRSVMAKIYLQVFWQRVSKINKGCTSFFQHYLLNHFTDKKSEPPTEKWLCVIGQILADKIGCYLDNLFTETFEPIITERRRDSLTANPVSMSGMLARRATERVLIAQKSSSSSANIMTEEVNRIKQMSKPYLSGMRDLFLFALLSNSNEMALNVWLDGQDHIGTALFGAKFLSNLAIDAERERFIDLAERYRSGAADWQRRATDVLAICYDEDPKRATQLLTRSLATWQGYNVLEIAFHARQEEFMGQPAVQTKVSDLWKGFPNRATLTSPKVKCILSTASTLLSLFLFSYFVIIGHDEETASTRSGRFWLELYIWLWTSVTFVEKLRESFGESLLNKFGERCRHFVTQKWNWIDLIGGLLLVTSRLVRSCPSPSVQSYTRTLYGLACLVYWIKAFRVLYVVEQLGSKVITLGRMMWDFLFFMALYLIILISFSVPIYVMMYPASRGGHVLNDVLVILYDRWWTITGISMDDSRREVEGYCQLNNNDSTMTTASDKSCSQRNRMGIFLLAVYLIITNIMLLNMLIAMLTHTIDTVRERSLNLWRFHFYQLTYEFYHKPLLPPPLTVIEWLYRLIIRRERPEKVKSVMPIDEDEIKQRHLFNDFEYLRLRLVSSEMRQSNW